ncbi:hypothetical protein HMPREF1345_00936 [Enterococcus faecium TX1337RF]|nr:hypothetical protein HMPREF1345_00936 [Enterococcus faecium TX1337RF]
MKNRKCLGRTRFSPLPKHFLNQAYNSLYLNNRQMKQGAMVNST